MWRKFGVPICWRKAQGIIHGKRCGVRRTLARLRECAGRSKRKASSENLPSLCGFPSRTSSASSAAISASASICPRGRSSTLEPSHRMLDDDLKLALTQSEERQQD